MDQTAGEGDVRCKCNHSFAAHGLKGDAGCTFCSCERFNRPAVAADEIELSRYARHAVELLTKLPELAHIPKLAIEKFAQPGHGRVFGPGSYLVRKGDTSGLLHVILAGQVVLETGHDGSGGHHGEIELGPGQIAGDLAAFTGGNRTASVTTNGPLEVLEVNVHSIKALFAEYPDLLLRITQILARGADNTDVLVEATTSVALHEFEGVAAGGSKSRLDPKKAMEIAARWRALKEQDAADSRAKEAARAAIDKQISKDDGSHKPRPRPGMFDQ